MRSSEPSFKSARGRLHMVAGLAAGMTAMMASGNTRASGSAAASSSRAAPDITSSAAAPSGGATTPAGADQPLQRLIPRSGEALPAIGLGTWRVFDVGENAAARNEVRAVLRDFVAAGARLIDSSPMYGSSESVLGALASELGIRAQLFVATKVWTRGRAEGIAQMRQSMRELQVQTVDLMQVHNLVDVDTQLATLGAWKREGRVRYIGVTHYTASAHAELERHVRSGRIDFVQCNYSLLEREAEQRLFAAAGDAGVAVLVNRPFGEGAFFEAVRGRPLPAIAATLGCASWAQFALKFVLGHPQVTCVIPATRNPRHLADNLAAARGPQPDAAMRREMLAAFARA